MKCVLNYKLKSGGPVQTSAFLTPKLRLSRWSRSPGESAGVPRRTGWETRPPGRAVSLRPSTKDSWVLLSPGKRPL